MYLPRQQIRTQMRTGYVGGLCYIGPVLYGTLLCASSALTCFSMSVLIDSSVYVCSCLSLSICLSASLLVCLPVCLSVRLTILSLFILSSFVAIDDIAHLLTS